MLDGMRKHANSFITSLLFAIIIIVFVFSFGPGSARYCGSPLPIVASVNGRAISTAQFQQQYARVFERMQSMRPNYTIETARAENLKQTVLEQLISRELLAQEAERRGLVISDGELAQTIVKTQLFHQNGAFDRDLYRRYANSLNLSEAAFEEEYRRDLSSDRLRSVVLDAVTVSNAEIRQVWERRNDRVDVWFVKLDPFFYKREIKVEDDEAKEFATKERAKIEDFYNQRATRYNQPEKVRARHILVKVDENAPEPEVKAAREKIDRAKERIGKGEDFAAVAKEMSDDGSAAQGGDLGLQPRGAWVKPFEDAAFALEPGGVSDVVRSKFGFHVIKVETKAAAVTRTLDEVATDIAREILVDERAKDRARQAAAQWQPKLAAAADPEGLNPKTEPATPDPFAPKVDSTGLFERGSRYVPKIGVAPELTAAAFALTKEAAMPESPVASGDRFYVIKLKERQTPDPETYETDRERLRSELISRRQMSALDEFVKELRGKAKVAFNTDLDRQGPGVPMPDDSW
ncbi:MAG: SurA N-terminal domain-containing protein [Deltaproteobacteria bacterium]|nr:SurA N-terminal domain-containing protein [Deltaproteobacteria bacterium]